MTAYGDHRERSPAFQGAHSAFPPPSGIQVPSNKSSDHTAVIAASRVGTSQWKAAKGNWTIAGIPPGLHDIVVKPRNDNATPSYIAANLAARQSTERLPSAMALPTSGYQFRPAPSRSYSDLSTQSKADRPLINTLISRYEGIDSNASRGSDQKHNVGNKFESSNVPENPGGDHSVRPMATKRPSLRQSPSILAGYPSDSIATSPYTSAADELSHRYQQRNIQGPPPTAVHLQKPFAKPSEVLSKAMIPKDHIKTSRPKEPLLLNTPIPRLSADSLADAMVASSLASSRAPSPTKPPLPPPRRRSRPHLLHRPHSADEADSRTPSPSKGTMRTTMRAPLGPGPDPLTAKHKSNRFINKHPNKHHEGDRKRWRDQITEPERKRYEGVWAANKGLMMSRYYVGGPSSTPINPADCVLDIVVRDIWNRSRLPADVLGEVWELVDGNRIRLLSQVEFVVGMWLVDQRLKGRKLPAKVSDSVWFSARGLTGIQVGQLLKERSGETNAAVGGDEGNQILQQDRFSTPGLLVQCTGDPIWFRSWSDHMHAKYYEFACLNAWEEMMKIEVQPHGLEVFEFLSEGTTPESQARGYRPMVTPRRYTGSAYTPIS
ncbi:MAG: hypothetical protein Q9219_003626 [cf. Caloplaca sp. 3 TL-2023]